MLMLMGCLLMLMLMLMRCLLMLMLMLMLMGCLKWLAFFVRFYLQYAEEPLCSFTVTKSIAFSTRVTRICSRTEFLGKISFKLNCMAILKGDLNIIFSLQTNNGFTAVYIFSRQTTFFQGRQYTRNIFFRSCTNNWR